MLKRWLTLDRFTHLLMILTLGFALWKLLVHSRSDFSYKPGDTIARSIWRTMPESKRTLIIVDRADCAFCRASMPFYVRLTTSARDAGLEVVSVTPDNPVGHQSYLDANHVHVDRTIQLKDTPLRVSGTPTLILLDQSKTVLGAWVGELSTDEESKVFHLIE